MSNPFTLTKNALDTLSPAVPHAQNVFIGTLPDLYIVYLLVDGTPLDHADNLEIARTYRMQLSIMSKTGLASLPDVDTVMLAAGFTRGPEREIPKDSNTSHYGLAKDYFYGDFV